MRRRRLEDTRLCQGQHADGLTGWGEFSPAFAGRAEPADFESTSVLIGLELGSTALAAQLRGAHRRGWRAQQAFGAVGNAVLDLRARALGVPVHELLGGAQRDRIPLYWAHCGTYRLSHADLIGEPPLRTLDDVVRLGRQVRERGFGALKTNLLVLTDGEPRRYKVGSGQPPVESIEPGVLQAIAAHLAALREGAGTDCRLMVDIGAGFSVPAALQVARAATRAGVTWLEVEGVDPAGLGELRARAGIPIATGERLRRPEARAVLDIGGADVLIVDVPFSGLGEAVRIADLAETFGLAVAPHNCYSPLATMMSAAFAAMAPNLSLMEIDVDGVAWEDELVTNRPLVVDGFMALPDGPGWGTEVNEAAVLAHPAAPGQTARSARCVTTWSSSVAAPPGRSWPPG